MIRPISIKRQADWRLYLAAKKEWRKDPRNQRCCVPGCKRPAEKDPHHSRGRLHALLYDTRFFKPVCRLHHNEIHANPEWARLHGLLPPVGYWNTSKPYA